MEINGGLLLDLDGGEVTMHATGSDGMVIEATTGDLTINVPAAGKKVLFNSNDDGIIAHSANANEQDFTIEQIGAHDASLFINSAGTGADALKLATSAGGMDISVTGTADLEDLDITTIGINTEIRMTSASTQDDAIDIESDGGIDITAAGIMDITSDGVMNITSDGVMNITTSAAASNITVDPNGAGTLALGTEDNTAVTAEALAVTLTAGNALTTTSNTFSITSDDGNSELKANAENAVLNVAAIGGGATQELQLFSEGTGASGIHIKTSGATGGIIIDASSQGGHAASDDVVIKANNFDVDGAGAVVAQSTVTAVGGFIGNVQCICWRGHCAYGSFCAGNYAIYFVFYYCTIINRSF